MKLILITYNNYILYNRLYCIHHRNVSVGHRVTAPEGSSSLELTYYFEQ